MNLSFGAKGKTGDNYQLILGRREKAFLPFPALKLKDRFRHVYMIGLPGTGKSELLTRMAKYDIDYGMAVIVIEPKGDIVRDLNYSVKDKDRIINLSFDNPHVINPLRKTGYNKNDISQEFIQILRLLISLTMDNPIQVTGLMSEIIKEALNVLPEEKHNIDDIFELLIDPQIRKQYHAKSRYWAVFDKTTKPVSAQNVATRLHAFREDERIRRIVSGPNELYVRDIAKERKILLVDTSAMSYEARIYISSLVTFAVKSYMEYEIKSYRDNPPLMLYVDEMQTCISEVFPDVMARSRGYKVGFALAHQDFASINEKILNRIHGIMGSIISFRVGQKESKTLSSRFKFEEADFSFIPDYCACSRIGTKVSFFKTWPFDQKAPPDYEMPTVPESEPIHFLRIGWTPV